jgi:hypothetical protein
MITYLILGGVTVLLAYRLWQVERNAEELQEAINKKNRNIWDLETEILTIRSTIQQGKDDLNQAKMISEKRIARVVKATINSICKWRVYFAGELLATFETEKDARDYAEFIDRQ